MPRPRRDDLSQSLHRHKVDGNASARSRLAGPMDVRFKSPQVRDPILASRLARAFASLSDSRSLLENESGLLSVVSRLITHHCMPGRALRAPGQEHAAVLKAKDWIDANSEQNVSIHSLAGLAGVSPYYLVRAFHREVGIPPHKYFGS